jgi:hypothetical protein
MTDTNTGVPAPEPSAVDKIARVPKHRRLNLSIAFGLYYLIAIWLAWFVYGGSTGGMVTELAEATGALSILALIAAVITIWIKSNIPFYIAIALACAANLSGHMDRIKEAMDAYTYSQHEMADATLENYRDKLVHSQTQTGQTFNSVSQIMDSVSAELASSLNALNDQQLINDLSNAETLSNREKRNKVEQRVRDKMALAQTTFPQVEALYDNMRENAYTELTKLNVPDMKGREPGHMQKIIKKSFLTGFDKARPENEKLTKAYIANYGDMYKHILAMLAILDANDGRFSIRQDGKVLFADDAPIAPYNEETADLQHDFINIQQIQGRMAQLRDAGIKKMIQPE